MSWFRGAADPVSLEPNCKSMVVYGANGSGKSSFVDGIEYVLNDGRIHHLAHEYSGKHQEKAIPNTHRPQGVKSELKIKFQDDSELKVEIQQDGSAARSGAEAIAMATWDYRRTVLRQDEVAAFIHDTKGGKYSALLPLLGLDPMEVAAENLRRLGRAVEQQSKLKETQATLKGLEPKRKATFGADSNELIVKKIADLHAKYCPDTAATTDASARCADVEVALDKRMAQFSADQRRHLALRGAADLDLKNDVAAVRAASVTLAGALEPFITEKLEVLDSTSTLVGKLGGDHAIDCPACGRSIAVEAFRAHVMAERERLQEIIDIFHARKAAIGTLCDTVKALGSNLSKTDAKSWRDQIAKTALAAKMTYLDGLDAEALRTSCDEKDLDAIEHGLLPLIHAAGMASEHAPADVQQLATDKQIAETANAVIGATDQAAAGVRAESLVAFLNSLEQGIRDEIKLRAQTVIDDISTDLKAMWAILHPDKAIEDVRFYLPTGADKAIDIALKFYGVAQESPRLTLSEGYRNSLGLCIFLAMAKRDAHKDRPLFLDDVVVSLDRSHRGLVVELLEKDFSDRQLIVLTHDRDWFTELRHQLDGKNWIFKTLLPYETPNVGIRWSHRTTTFDDARAHLKDRPDSAGNDARKIMDVELGFIAERLRIQLPYMRGEKNERRGAHDFLERLVADGKVRFRRKVGTEHKPYAEAIGGLDTADGLLVSWANKGSHTFDLVGAEAGKLIDACEKALDVFRCAACGKTVWFADAAASELVQCECGELRWRYGKA